jgi:hypothetical protein
MNFTSLKDRKMTETLDNVKSSYNSSLANINDKTSKFNANVLAIAGDYSTKSLDDRVAFMETMLGAKSLGGAMEAHAEYAKTCYESFVALGQLYSNLAKEAFKPLEIASPDLPSAKVISSSAAFLI